MEESWRTSRKLVVVFGTAKPAARRSSVPALRPTIAAASTDSTRCTASKCTRPMKPLPNIAVRVTVIEVPTCLGPPRGRRLLAHHDVVEEVRGFRQALAGREQAVFVFDRDYIIVAEHSQRGDQFTPKLHAVTVAAGAENPCAVAFLCVRLSIEHARAHHITRIQLGIFRVNVKDCVPE